MTATRIHRSSALLLALALPLGACHSSSPPTGRDATPAATASTDAPDTMIGKAVEKGMREAREELENGNLSLNGGGIHIGKHGKGVWSGNDHDGLPRAEITPQGDLLIEGKPVAVDARQRALLLDYRKQVIAVAEGGMAIGTQGAELAGKAMTQALASIFDDEARGNLEHRMEAEGKKIEAQARLLCNRLPQLLETQETLAASLPAFKPYARMTQADIDDCMDDSGDDADRAEARARVRDEVRSRIRQAVRQSVRGSVATAGEDASTSQQ